MKNLSLSSLFLAFLEAFKYIWKKNFFKYYFYIIGIRLFSIISFLTISYYCSILLAHSFLNIDFLSQWLTSNFSQKALFFSIFISLSISFIFIEKYLFLVFASPFLGILAEKVYEEKTGRTISPNFYESLILIRRTIRLNFYALIIELSLGTIFFILSFVDIINITYLLSFGVTTFFLGFSYIDYGLELYQKTTVETQFFAKKNKYTIFSLGFIFSLFLWIPIFSPIITLITSVIYTINQVENETNS